MLTGTTRLTRRVPAINLNESAPVPTGLVLQLAHKLAPSHVVDGFSERMVLDHILDCQTLDTDHLVFVNNATGELVLVIPPSVSDTRVDASNFEASFCPVLAALLLLGQSSLRFR